MDKKDFIKSVDGLSEEIERIAKRYKVPEELIAGILYERTSGQRGVILDIFERARGEGKGRTPNWVKLGVTLLSEDQRQ